VHKNEELPANNNSKDHSILNDVLVQGASHANQEDVNNVNENEQPNNCASSFAS